MKKNIIFIQLGLLFIGIVLVFFFYFYPNMKASKLKEKTIQKEIAGNETDTIIKNEFTNVIYKGENAGNIFTIHADKAEIRKDADLIYMKNMFVTIVLGDEDWIIECEVGTYDKTTYDITCSKNMKAASSDGHTTIYSQNLNFIADEFATIYNKVSIIDKEGFELQSDRIFYDFESKIYKVNMFNTDEDVKIKLIKWKNYSE